MFNDFPDEFPDYNKAHMGVFNDDNYCNNHDLLLLSNPDMVYKKYFMSDYHQLSLTRMFVMNKIGIDVMPWFSKN